MEKNQNFETQVLADGPTLVEFWAPWCGYCRRIQPVVGQLKDEYAGKISVVTVNIDEHEDWAEQFAVDTIPTLMLFHDKQAGKPLIAPASKSEITDWMKANGIQ